jgi:hypothetical protein
MNITVFLIRNVENSIVFKFKPNAALLLDMDVIFRAVVGSK